MAEQARREVVNGDQPARVPVLRMGNVAVIVHVVWSDGAGEWQPVRAIRWTSMHVMVGWREDTGGRPGDRWEWLRAQDAMRSVSWLVAPTRP